MPPPQAQHCLLQDLPPQLLLVEIFTSLPSTGTDLPSRLAHA